MGMVGYSKINWNKLPVLFWAWTFLKEGDDFYTTDLQFTLGNTPSFFFYNHFFRSHTIPQYIAKLIDPLTQDLLRLDPTTFRCFQERSIPTEDSSSTE